MTASYSEISFDSQPSPSDNKLLADSLDLDNGTISSDLEKSNLIGNRPDKLDLNRSSQSPEDDDDLDPPSYNKAIGYLQHEGTVMQVAINPKPLNRNSEKELFI